MVETARDDPVDAGSAALACGDWSEARERFETALVADPGSGPAWEGLAVVEWWVGDGDRAFDAEESAFRAYRETGDRRGAARIATWLAANHREFRGEVAVGRGWLHRARALLAEEGGCPERGWLALIQAEFSLHEDGEPEAAVELAREGAQLGRELDEPALAEVALALEGLSLVAAGELDEGMRQLDGAAAVALTEETGPLVARGWTFCCLMHACDSVGDFERALQWCQRARSFSERFGGRHFLGICRTTYGRILSVGGRWTDAEGELEAAVEDFRRARPAMAAEGLIRLGELRARQGREDEARELFEQAGQAGLVGIGQLALDSGDARGAAELAERVLRHAPATAPLARLPALELRARAEAELGLLERAEESLAELEAIGACYATPYLRARSRLAAADFASAGGNEDDARRAYEDAIDCFEAASAPYDAALARVRLARVLRRDARTDRARREAAAAREVFARLGARRDVEYAERLLAETPPGSDGGGLGELTPRELEVLRLVAEGLSDAEIANRLVVSPHTVHRHVANVRAKLGLSSRAAAVGYAVREGLL